MLAGSIVVTRATSDGVDLRARDMAEMLSGDIHSTFGALSREGVQALRTRGRPPAGAAPRQTSYSAARLRLRSISRTAPTTTTTTTRIPPAM